MKNIGRLQVMMRCILLISFTCLSAQWGWAQFRKAVLPYRVVAHKMIVDLKINGKTYPFVFDTGGTMGIIDRVCDELQLPENGSITITDVTGNNTTFPKCNVREVKIPKGNLSFANVPVMKMVTPSPVERFGVVGLLGSDLWRNAIVHIDHKKQVITVTSAEKPVELDDRYRIPFIDKNGICPVVSVFFGDHAIRALFDSGAYSFLSLKETDYRDLYSWNMTKLLDRGFGRGPSGVGGTQIPRVETKRVWIAPIKVGSAILKNAITDELTTATQTILGMRMLEYGEVTIDYERRLFYFVPYQEISQVDVEFYPLAFELKLAGKELRVSQVWGDLKKSIKLGDKLVAINGKNIEKYDTREILMKGIPQVTGKKKNELTILTKGGEKKVIYEAIVYH